MAGSVLFSDYIHPVQSVSDKFLCIVFIKFHTVFVKKYVNLVGFHRCTGELIALYVVLQLDWSTTTISKK